MPAFDFHKAGIIFAFLKTNKESLSTSGQTNLSFMADERVVYVQNCSSLGIGRRSASDNPRQASWPNSGKGHKSRMADSNHVRFDPTVFLAQAGVGRKIVHLKSKEPFFSQGDPADSIFYIQSGRAKLTVISKSGKEATIALLLAGNFVGEESLAGTPGLRMATAIAISPCVALRIERAEMIRAMHEEHLFSDLFLKFLLERSMKTQADLVDQLFNSSEKRLARILLLMADFGQPGEQESALPKISQEMLAEMIGTTRSRVSFFMNRFRKLGFIEYNGVIKVHKSLLNVVLHD